jgi:poly [ADP-ribose] polymerase
MPNVVEHKKFICVNFDGTNNNKYWQYTLYDDDTALTEWGRVGKKLGEKEVTKSKALAKMREKTRPNNKPDKLYTEVKVAEGTTQATVGQVQASKLKDIAQKQIDIKDPKLKELVDFLVKENVHNIVSASGGSITYDTSSAQFKTPLGVIMPDQIDEARRLLDDMSVPVMAHDYSNRQLSRDLQAYLRLVPHAVGMSKISPELILPNPQALQKENSLLDGIQASFNDIQAGVVKKGKKPTTNTPKLFDVTLDVVRDRKILAHIKKYFNDTKLNSHVTSGYKIKKVYEVKIGSMNKAYEKVGLPIGNVMELWHGTKCSNLLSILKVGLIIPRSSSGHVTGRMFGDGLYFSDQSTKALNYATNFWGRGGSTKRIFMFLSDVAMGKYYVPSGWTSRLPKTGYHSTFAKAGKSGVRNNEMIVYKTNQANLKYLIEFE